MGGPGFYGPMGAAGDESSANLETRGQDSLNACKGDTEDFKKEANEGDDKNESQGPTREAFMDPEFGGFYDDLAAGPPTDHLPLGDRPFEKGLLLTIVKGRDLHGGGGRFTTPTTHTG